MLLSLFGLWIAVWAAVSLVAPERSGHEVDELLDARMARLAQVLREISLAGTPPVTPVNPQLFSAVGHPYEAKLSYQRWQGERLYGLRIEFRDGAAGAGLCVLVSFPDPGGPKPYPP